MCTHGRIGVSKRAAALWAAAAGVTLSGPVLAAVNGTWKDDSGGNWSDSHWTGGNIADGADAIADFSTVNISNDRTVTFNTSRTLGTFKIGDNDSSPNESWTFSAGSGKSLTLQTTSGNASIQVLAGDHTISAPIILKNNLDLLISSGDSLILSGVLSTSSGTTDFALGTAGSGTSSGTVSLRGSSANTYSGTVTVNGGKLELRKSSGVNAITGDLIIGDGTGGSNTDIVDLYNSNQIANTAAVTINSSGLLDLSDDDTLETIGSLSGSGNITLGDNSNLTVGDSSSTSFSGVISGSGLFTKVGTGTLTFTGATANSYSDDTTVTGGVLALNKSSGGSGVTSIKGNLIIGNGTNTASVRLDYDDQINNSSDVTINANATLDLQTSDKSDRIGSLGGAGEIKLGSGSLLTFGESSSKTFSGVISGSGGITKMGSGTQTLSGSSSNTFTGLTTISSGELDLNKSGGAIAISGDVTINNSTTLKLLAANQIGSGSTVTVTGTFNLNGKGTSAGSNKIGTLAVTGGTLSTGNSTTYLTVVNDYTNSGFASGNSFDPRASGAHVDSDLMIDADGSNNQTLSGDSHLTDGDSTTPTLAMGNVRAGVNNSLTVNLNWSGDTGGPKLRGAIQTGNLSGTPFSITGITSSSGANFALDHDGSLPLEINFNSASTGLTGKTIRILNNFDNVRDQTLSISATAYRYAATDFSGGTLNFGAIREMATVSPQTVSISNTAANDGYSDNLGASFGTPTNNKILAGGSAAITPGQSGSGSLSVSIDSSSAGAAGGTLPLNLISSPTVSGPDTDHLVGSYDLAVTGGVYRYADSGVTNSLDFGMVHVNDTVGSQNVSVTNTAANDGYSDDLKAEFGSVSGTGIFHNGAQVTLASGQTSTLGTMTIGIDTTSTGSRDGSVQVLLTSVPTQGGLDSKSLASATVNITGTVMAYASPLLQSAGGGTLSGGGNTYLIDLGQVDGSPASALLKLLNDVVGPADDLKGSFDVSAAGVFGLGGFVDFDSIGAGQSLEGLSVSLDPSAGVGVHTGSIILHPRSTNPFYDEALASGDITINLQGEVMPEVAVPEPAGLTLLALTGGFLAVRRRRRAIRKTQNQ